MIAKNKRLKKESNGSVFFAIFLLLLVLGFVGLLLTSNFRISQKRAELSGEIESLKREVQSMEDKNTELQEKISQSSKESFWEEKVREQGYQKPGENQVVVLPPQGEKQEATGTEKNIFQKLLEKISF